ncbi:MAG: class I SAM-dependent methyltransferase [Sphingobacteriales bacterium]|jgi:SAM-dependent methyltransferase
MNDNMKFFTDGAAYEQLMGRWSRRVGNIFLDWVAAPQGLHWLDVGCGNGAFTETIIARCAPAEIEGVDPSEAQIAYARRREPAKRARFRTGDAQALPFADASFDAAGMALVISFVPAPAKAAAEMARVVRPGGWVATYMRDLPNGGLPLAPLARRRALGLTPPPEPPNAEVSRLENMQALWNGAGLKDVEARRIDIEVSYDDFEDSGNPPPCLATLRRNFCRRCRRRRWSGFGDWLRKSLPSDANGRIRYEAFASAVKGRVPG